MSTEYEKLLSLVTKINKSDGERCLICHFPDKNENLIKLKCKHYFHLNCIPSNNKLSEYIKCPYCDKNSKIIKNIEPCNAILQRGPNKGKECGRENCKYHKSIKNKKEINNNSIPEMCQIIIKSGSRKGQVCSRINCHYHKSKSIVV